MVAVLLAALLLPRQEPTISFESPGITVQAFCEELSRQTGKKFVAWDSERDDLVAVHLTQAPLEETLKRLQFAERAKLDFDGTTYNLRPDEAVRAKLRADYLAYRIKAIKASQDRVRSLLRSQRLDDSEAKAIALKISDLQAKEKAHDEADNEAGSVDTWLLKQDQLLRLPTGNTMLQMFLALSPEEIAAISPNGNAVWSTSPTPVERPSPIDANALLSGLNTDEQVWSDDAAKFLSADASTYIGRRQAFSGQVALLRFEMSTSGGPCAIMQLTGFDSSGKSLFEDVQNSRTENDLSPTDSTPTAPLVVPITPTTEKMIQLWSGYPSQAEMAKWVTDKTFLEMFFNPEKYNPAAETFGRAMIELAKARNVQMIASEKAESALRLPENCAAKEKLDAGLIQHEFEIQSKSPFPRIQFSSDGNWITVRPGLLDDEATYEFDRAALGKLYRTARDEHRLTLMDVARFAAGHEAEFGPFALRSLKFLSVAVPNLSGYQLLVVGEWPLKTFLGRLDDTQIAIAQQPDGLPLANCTPGQLACLDLNFQLERFSYHGQTKVWRSYTTDALPNGLPGNGVLHLSIANGTAIEARTRDSRQQGYIADQFLSPEELAQEIKKAAAARGWHRDLLGVTPQTSQTFTFDFEFPDQTSKIEDLEDYRPLAKEVKTIDELPEPLRGLVKTAMDKEAK